MQALVRRNGRLALYYQRADENYWNATWNAIPYETLHHVLRSTRRLGVHGFFFRHNLPRNAVILEAGCGTGMWVRRLRENGWNCIGLDYALPSLVRSKSVCPELPLLCGDILQLPFPTNSLAAYISFGVVEHFPEGPKAALIECVRVLREGGVALISVPYDSPVRRSMPTVEERDALARGLRFYQFYFSPADMRQELVLAGLKPTGSFHGYGVNGGLVGPLAFLKPWVRRFGALAYLFDFFPGLPRLAAHMIFVAAIKPSGHLER